MNTHTVYVEEQKLQCHPIDAEVQTLSILDSLDKPPNEWCLEDVSDLTFRSVEEAEQFYNAYAWFSGFSIRKDKISMVGETITMRKFLCSKAGYRRQQEKDVGQTSLRRPRHETRCGCTASFKVRIDGSDLLYHPVEFNVQHNHELVPTKYSHFLPSHRHIDDASAQQIAELRAAGVKPAQIMNFFVNSRGGYDQVGFTRRDLYNHLYNSNTAVDAPNEFDLALHYVSGLVRMDPGVVCRVFTNDENQITRFFFSDTISMTEYSMFGDVVCCDATYKTNRLRIPLVLLSGVDNHINNIIFACALITDEEKETYQWVYETFISCMGKAPTLFITDGDRAMRWAVRESMPHTRHRLCSWHIMRNLQGVCQNSFLKRDLEKLMNKRYTVHEFNDRWQQMLDKYGLSTTNNRWVNEMSSTTTMWGEAFFVGMFTAGVRSNQRAESQNSTLKRYVDSSLSISGFFHKYFNFLDHIRQKTMRNECANLHSMPANVDEVFHTIQTQLGQTYTLAVYEKVDKQIKLSEPYTCDIRNLVSDATIYHLEVVRYDGGRPGPKKVIVTLDRRDGKMDCECGMMESSGLPCKHIFAAIKQLQLLTLADCNFNRRWMKDARRMCNLTSSMTQTITGSAKRLILIRPVIEQLAYTASLGESRMAIAMQEINSLTQRISCIHVGDEDDDHQAESLGKRSRMPPVFRDPPVVRTKGAPSVRKATTPRKCSYCHEPGHSKPTCERKQQDEGNIISKKKKQAMETVL